MDKERITITLDRTMLDKIDSTIDGKTVRNRSHAIESILARSINKNTVNTVLILAGGKGTRLRPITYEIQKSMIPVKGKPILEHQISMLKKFDIRNILLSVGGDSDTIREYFGDGKRFGVNITYIVEDKPLGTGGPLLLAKQFINDTFLMMNADTLADVNLDEMINFHKKERCKGTILLATSRDPQKKGMVRLRGNRVSEFVEKPTKNRATSNLINGGFYILEPEVIRHVPRGRKYMSEELFVELIKQNKLAGYVFDSEIFDIGDHQGYENAIKNWRSNI